MPVLVAMYIPLSVTTLTADILTDSEHQESELADLEDAHKGSPRCNAIRYVALRRFMPPLTVGFLLQLASELQRVSCKGLNEEGPRRSIGSQRSVKVVLRRDPRNCKVFPANSSNCWESVALKPRVKNRLTICPMKSRIQSLRPIRAVASSRC